MTQPIPRQNSVLIFSWVTYHLPVCPKFGPGRNVTDMWDLGKTCGKNLHHEIRKYHFVVVEDIVECNQIFTENTRIIEEKVIVSR